MNSLPFEAWYTNRQNWLLSENRLEREKHVQMAGLRFNRCIMHVFFYHMIHTNTNWNADLYDFLMFERWCMIVRGVSRWWRWVRGQSPPHMCSCISTFNHFFLPWLWGRGVGYFFYTRLFLFRRGASTILQGRNSRLLVQWSVDNRLVKSKEVVEIVSENLQYLCWRGINVLAPTLFEENSVRQHIEKIETEDREK